MSIGGLRRSTIARASLLVITLLFVASACRVLPPGELAPESGPEPSPTPAAKTMCQSSADLRADVELLRSLELSEDGLLSVIVAADAALGEARTLADLVSEQYRPLVMDVVVSLQDLRATVSALEDEETVGAGIASIGEAITETGNSMDTLALACETPVPRPTHRVGETANGGPERHLR